MNIPEKLYQNIKNLANNYSDGNKILQSLQNEAYRGIRVNTLKCSLEDFYGFDLGFRPTPFCKNGFYIDTNFKAGNHPLHHAGAYYVQEPSATSAVTVLNPQPGERILDLCAAPGGKSTQIAAQMNDTGLLISNDAVKSRANIIVSNFERMGISCGVVTSLLPDELCNNFTEFFDRVLVDAPCSGEGMLKKESEAALNWSEENVNSCAVRQQKILNSAAALLKEGGILVYSTCTFSYAENEGNIKEFLENHKEFVLEEITQDFGRAGINMPQVRRIFPVDGGEGHFVAKLKKSGNSPRKELNNKTHKPVNTALLDDFLKQNNISLPSGYIKNYGGKFYLSPIESLPENIKPIREGILLNQPNDKRFVPSHAMFMCPKVKVQNSVDFNLQEEIFAFLHGEEISVNNNLKGYIRVTFCGIACGFGKASGGKLKNYYPKGLRTVKKYL